MSVVSEIILAGVDASKPTLTTYHAGYLYYATDTEKLYRWSGSAWVQVAAPAGGGAVFIKADGSVAFTGDQSMGTNQLTNVGDPGSAQDAATKSYVDGVAANLGKRARVRAATTANITIATALNNGDTLDGVSLVTGDWVLVKDQTAAEENGVYEVGVSPARASEFNTYDEHPGSLIAVQEGTANEDTVWLCTSNVGGTLGVNDIDFSSLGTGSNAFEDLTTSETDTSLVAAPDGLGGLEFRAETGGGGTSFFGLKDFVAPPTAGWTWDNQGTATITSSTDIQYLLAPKKSAVQLVGRYRTPVNANWRIEVCMLHDLSGAAGDPGSDVGYLIGFRDSGGKVVTILLQLESTTPKIATHKWTNSTTYSAAYVTPTYAPDGVYKNPCWLRADYDGTNIIVYTSVDGVNWFQYDTRTRADFLAAGTPNFLWGAYVNASGARVSLVSYEETALP